MRGRLMGVAAGAASLLASTAWAGPNTQDPFLAPTTVTVPAAAQLLVPPLVPNTFMILTVITGTTSNNLFNIIGGGTWTKADFDPASVTLQSATNTGGVIWTTRGGGTLSLLSGVLTYKAGASSTTVTDTFNMALSAGVAFGTTIIDNWSQVFTVSVTVPPVPGIGGVIRFRNVTDNTHHYSADPREVGQIANGQPFLVNEGLAFKGVAPPPGTSSALGTIPAYHFFQAATGLHLFTATQAEINFLVPNAPLASTNFQPVNLPFYVYNQPGSGVPVFRLFNVNNGDHLLTINGSERSSLLAQRPMIWVDEGIAFWAAP